MVDLTRILYKIDNMKVLVDKDSISPNYLGVILEEMMGAVADVDMTDYIPIITGHTASIQTLTQATADAMQRATEAAQAAANAQSTADGAVAEAKRAYEWATCYREAADDELAAILI